MNHFRFVYFHLPHDLGVSYLISTEKIIFRKSNVKVNKARILEKTAQFWFKAMESIKKYVCKCVQAASLVNLPNRMSKTMVSISSFQNGVYIILSCS